MSTYRTFVKQSILNYLIGSVVAVVGVGGMFIFSTLQITKTELIYLTFILFSSLIIMCVAELLMFKKHLKRPPAKAGGFRHKCQRLKSYCKTEVFSKSLS